ncbi:uncharacterized protein DMAD_11020 [Drosophila madeirensis]|uniref:Uncharacterized protein n=1 Tax=Drosophila madeirensis TaxID=30013 RepID=A0AAU9FBT5_DROMD
MRALLVVLVNLVLSPQWIQGNVQKSEFRDAITKTGKDMKIAIQMDNELMRNVSHGKPFTERATSPDKKVFRIQPIKNAIVQISYSKPQGDHPPESHSAKRRKQPTYFINFNFQNRGNSKPTVDQPSPTIQPKMLRTRGKRLRNGLPNPYKTFPLKGENI